MFFSYCQDQCFLESCKYLRDYTLIFITPDKIFKTIWNSQFKYPLALKLWLDNPCCVYFWSFFYQSAFCGNILKKTNWNYFYNSHLSGAWHDLRLTFPQIFMAACMYNPFGIPRYKTFDLFVGVESEVFIIPAWCLMSTLQAIIIQPEIYICFCFW